MELPVKCWIHELHFKRFGFVLGEKPLSAQLSATEEGDEQAGWPPEWEPNHDDGTRFKDDDVPF